jgi:hypothetical protein
MTEITSFAKQAEYWKGFIKDLIFGSIKRLIGFPILFGLAFFIIAVFIFKLGIQAQETHAVFKTLETVAVFPLYTIVGFICGLIYAVVRTLSKI